MMSKARMLFAAAALGALVLGFAAACGDDDGAEPTATTAAEQPTEPPATEPAGETPTEPAGETPAEGTSLTVVASGFAFDQAELTAAAGQALTVTLDNQDSGIPHTFSLYRDEEHSDLVAETEQVTGPATGEASIPALDAGEYYYRCDIHTEQMQGELLVQ
jgi:plastocyanin